VYAMVEEFETDGTISRRDGEMIPKNVGCDESSCYGWNRNRHNSWSSNVKQGLLDPWVLLWVLLWSSLGRFLRIFRMLWRLGAPPGGLSTPLLIDLS
jgi:hypothetical protein